MFCLGTNHEVEYLIKTSTLCACSLTSGGRDYSGLGMKTLQLVPGGRNIYNITIFNDNEVEADETFKLNLTTTQFRVTVQPAFHETVVTINDDDSK